MTGFPSPARSSHRFRDDLAPLRLIRKNPPLGLSVGGDFSVRLTRMNSRLGPRFLNGTVPSLEGCRGGSVSAFAVGSNPNLALGLYGNIFLRTNDYTKILTFQGSQSRKPTPYPSVRQEGILIDEVFVICNTDYYPSLNTYTHKTRNHFAYQENTLPWKIHCRRMGG